MFEVDSTAEAGRCSGVPAVSKLRGVGNDGYLLLLSPDAGPSVNGRDVRESLDMPRTRAGEVASLRCRHGFRNRCALRCPAYRARGARQPDGRPAAVCGREAAVQPK